MEIKIYQVNHERDANRVKFLALDQLERIQGSSEIDSKIYDWVFHGSVDCKDLEDVYTMFNVNHPAGFRGHSLSVSDIVEIAGKGFYFCDSIGFQKVSFEPEKTMAVEKPEMIRVLIVEPGKAPYAADIENDLKASQRVVGGWIESISPFNDPVNIICNEEGKLDGLPLNRALRDKDGNIYDIVAGTFFLTGFNDEGDFCSLTEEQIARYTEMYRTPEVFVRVNGEIVAIPDIENPNLDDVVRASRNAAEKAASSGPKENRDRDSEERV